MVQENELLDIIDGIIAIRKKRDKSNPINRNVPEYYNSYDKYVDWMEQISYHSVKGKIPYEMIERKAPNQSDQEKDWVVNNFKQITLPVFYEFLSVVARGLHDSNWSIDYANDQQQYITSDMTFKKYVEDDIASTPLSMSFDSWVRFVFPTIKLTDSMGVITFKPYNGEKTTLDTDGNIVVAGDELPEPIPYYYSSDRVLSRLEWGYLLIEANDYSIVEFNGKRVREGLVFELYDDINIWRIYQVGKKNDYQFEYELIFRHDLGYIPADYLKGKPTYNVDGALCWQSPFLMVTDLLDDVLLDGCNLRAIKASCTYPQKVMIGNDCEFQDDHGNKCVQGYIMQPDNGGFYKCPECHGSGLAQRTSPLNTILVRTDNSKGTADTVKPADALAFIAPDMNTPTFLREEIDNGLVKALSILHLKTTNSKVQGAEDMTATGMVLDEKGKYAFIKTIVDQIFDFYEFGMKVIGQMRYGNDFEKPYINRPVSYDFNSESDYLQQIAAVQEAGAPPSIVALYVYKYIKAIFYDNATTAKVYDLIIASDRLFSLNKEQIAISLSRNLAEKWEVVLHDSALTFVSELIRENENFLDQEMSVKIEQLQAKAQENTPQDQAQGRLNPQTILANANAQGTA